MIRKEFFIVFITLLAILSAAFVQWKPIRMMMDWKAARDAGTAHGIDTEHYEIVDHADGDTPFITVDFLQGPHFWHPQVAIWLEDSAGNYLETLLVTSSTARGLFYAGRTPENFKEYDENPAKGNYPTARVDALPYWSHKRGIQYADGFYSPDRNHPIVDGTSSATPKGNFYLKSSSKFSDLNWFRVLVEINVAFDENEYYSEFDFLEDSLYHSGTGLLGQPSVIYGKLIQKSNDTNYYILDLLGHGHHSGSDGMLYEDMSTVTTAAQITERIVVGINPPVNH